MRDLDGNDGQWESSNAQHDVFCEFQSEPPPQTMNNYHFQQGSCEGAKKKQIEKRQRAHVFFLSSIAPSLSLFSWLFSDKQSVTTFNEAY